MLVPTGRTNQKEGSQPAAGSGHSAHWPSAGSVSGHEAPRHWAQRFSGPSPLWLSPGDLHPCSRHPYITDSRTGLRPRGPAGAGAWPGSGQDLGGDMPLSSPGLRTGTSRHATEVPRPQMHVQLFPCPKSLLWTEPGAPKIHAADLTPGVTVWRQKVLEVQ